MEKENTIRTLDDLVKELGELSPEECTLLNDPKLNDPPTKEELDFLGPDFSERITRKVLKEEEEK